MKTKTDPGCPIPDAGAPVSDPASKARSTKAKGQRLILPCPFCGGKARTHMERPAPPELPAKFFSVACPSKNNCGVWPVAFGDTLAEAVARWNNRNQPSRSSGTWHQDHGFPEPSRSSRPSRTKPEDKQ